MSSLPDSSLSVAILQSDLAWEDPQSNMDQFTSMFKDLPQNLDLVVLPETFSTAFTMNVEQNYDKNGVVLNWMQKSAAKHKFSIAGSIIVRENGKYYNRLYFVRPEGQLAYYDKRHLFGIGGERDFMTAGKERVVVEMKNFRILLQICYDLRFPVFSRNIGDYDAIIYVANWPGPRQHVWDTLTMARAIENQAYVLGANRTGTDGENINYLGASVIVDPKGIRKARLSDKPGFLISSLSKNELIAFRKKFPAHEDADKFKLI